MASCHASSEGEINKMKKANIEKIKEALRIQGRKWSATAATAIALEFVMSVVAFWAGMPMWGILGVAGILALVISFYCFAVKPLLETEE